MKKMRCKKCKHEWNHKDDLIYYVTCPRCYNKVRTEKDDKGKVNKHINDWIDNNPPVNSELSSAIIETNKSLQKVTKVTGIFAKEYANYGLHIKSHIGAIQELGSGVEKLEAGVRQFTKMLTKIEAKL